MNNLKSLLAAVLVLAMSLSLCACGGEAETPADTTAAPVVTEAPAETEAPAQEVKGGYTITVVDENGNPIAGAMVQMCKDTCYPGVTDEDGTVTFDLAEDDYKVSFLALPAGYTYVDETQEFHFEEGSMTLTITLKAAE